LELIMNGFVVLAACVCAASGQLVANTAWAPHQSHQFHAQDEFGQYSFGYAGGPSARTESRNAYGVTTGSYQQVDANGILRTINYIADPLNGFRVQGDNLPIAPAAPATVVLAGPAPVAETPEVAAARAEHEAAYAAAAEAAAAAPEERKRREADTVVAAAPAYPYAYAALGGLYAAAPAQIIANAYNYAPAALPADLPAALPAALPATYAALPAALPAAVPATYAAGVVSAPAAREATLTTIKLNPGHAVSYKVD